MNAPIPSRSGDEDPLGALSRQVRSLQTNLHATLVALLLMAGGFNLTLLWQIKLAREQRDDVRSALESQLSEFEKVSQVRIDEFIGKLTQFGQEYPDFKPILNRYLPSTDSPGTASSRKAKAP